MNVPRGLRVLLWTTRIVATLIVVLMAFMLIGDAGNPPTSDEILLLALFPVGMCVGYVVAWRWPLVGGSISVACIVIFLMTLGEAETSMVGIVSMLGIPGILFILYALLTRRTNAAVAPG